MNPRFAPGDPVRVQSREVDGHVRTPSYIMGKRGVVERVAGAFGNPEELADGRRDGERVALYRVRFNQLDVWASYAGASEDSLDVELFEHWLEPAERQS